MYMYLLNVMKLLQRLSGFNGDIMLHVASEQNVNYM